LGDEVGERSVAFEDPRPQESDGDPREDVGAEDRSADEAEQRAWPVQCDGEQKAESHRPGDDEGAVSERRAERVRKVPLLPEGVVVRRARVRWRGEQVPRVKALYDRDEERIQKEYAEQKERRSEHPIRIGGAAGFHPAAASRRASASAFAQSLLPRTAS